MIRFESTLMNSQDRHTERQNPLFPLLLLAVSIIAYFLPWVSNPGASLTLNAYDLADWISLSPAARSTSPVLLDSLLLRLPLVCALLIITFYTAKWKRLSLLLIIVFAVALLPPFEFITKASGDINYRQQFGLSAITFLGGLIILSGLLGRVGRWLIFILSLTGIISGIWGFAHAEEAMRQFGLSAGAGIGVIALGLMFAALLCYAFITIQKTRRFSPNS
jgi:hypothetical protein